jgi:hypothetical protein
LKGMGYSNHHLILDKVCYGDLVESTYHDGQMA